MQNKENMYGIKQKLYDKRKKPPKSSSLNNITLPQNHNKIKAVKYLFTYFQNSTSIAICFRKLVICVRNCETQQEIFLNLLYDFPNFPMFIKKLM